jgi:hypothetical protein
MVVCPKQNVILVHFLCILELIPCQSITFFMVCITSHLPCTILCNPTLQSSACILFGPWHSDNWIINFRSNRYMLALGMLAYLKWIKWHAWLWMSRIMRYVWVQCWCHLHSHCQNGNWNIHCSDSSSTVSAVSHLLLLNCCACCCTFIFLSNVPFSFHLFVHHLVVPSFLPLSPACTTVQLHSTQIIEGMNAVLYDVLRPVVATFNCQKRPVLASADVVSCVLFKWCSTCRVPCVTKIK